MDQSSKELAMGPDSNLPTGATLPNAPRRVSMPISPYSRPKMLGGLVLVMLVLSPILFVAFHESDVTEEREAESLAIARQTWQRQVAVEDPYAWAIPMYQGIPRFDPPPMTTWLHMLAWTGLKTETADSSQLIRRARVMGIICGMIVLMSTYWAGMSIGDVRVARLATLALGTTLLFVYQVRMASSDTHMLCFTTFAIAAGFWAMRPLKDIAWVGRRVFGWLLAGLALGAAVLTQGAKPAALFVLPPLLAAILLTPRRRLDNLIGLTFAATLGVLTAAPWYLYVLGHSAKADLFGHILPESPELFVLTPTHFRLLVVLSPWAVWLIGSLFQPFIRADHDRRRQLLIAWSWFLLLFAILSIPAAQSPRYLTPLLPAAALLVGQLWAFHAQLASERQMDPGVDWLRVPHWLTLGIASILGPSFIVAQPWLMERGYLGQVFIPGMLWWQVSMLGAALFLIVCLGVRWHYKWKPRLAAYATVGWMLATLLICLPGYARSEDNRYGPKGTAEDLRMRTVDHRVLRLQGGPEMNDRFAFYFGRSIATISDRQVADVMTSPVPTLLLVPRDRGKLPELAASLKLLGLEPVWAFDDSGQPYFLMQRSQERASSQP